MIYLFDTSVLISLFRQDSEEAIAFIERVKTKDVDAAISVITYYELWRGAKEHQILATRSLLRLFKLQSLSRQIADRASEIYKDLPKFDSNQKKRLQLDLLIAATADYYHHDIVTINPKDFSIFALNYSQIVSLKKDHLN